MTIPSVPVPEDGSVRTPLDVTLKPGWRYDASHRRFESDAGERFAPHAGLPAGSRIVYKVPSVARADPATLDEHERELRRYMQIVLPHGEPPGTYLRAVRGWPPVEEVHVGPDVSLPLPPPPGR